MVLICLRVIFLESDETDEPMEDSIEPAVVSPDTGHQNPSVKTLRLYEFEQAMEILGVPFNIVAQNQEPMIHNDGVQRFIILTDLNNQVRKKQTLVKKLEEKEAAILAQVRHLSHVKAELDERVESLIHRATALQQKEEAKLDDRVGFRMIDSEVSLFDDVSTVA